MCWQLPLAHGSSLGYTPAPLPSQRGGARVDEFGHANPAPKAAATAVAMAVKSAGVEKQRRNANYNAHVTEWRKIVHRHGLLLRRVRMFCTRLPTGRISVNPYRN